MKKEKKTFWITNISKRNVTLSDLNISIPAFSSVNLLDSRHYYFTEEQLNKSFSSGSIFIKRDKVKKRNADPIVPEEKEMEQNTLYPSPSRTKSIYQIKEENYDELKFDNDLQQQEFEFIDENQPLLSRDKGQ